MVVVCVGEVHDTASWVLPLNPNHWLLAESAVAERSGGVGDFDAYPPSSRLDRYEILKKLGEGGMGTVPILSETLRGADHLDTQRLICEVGLGLASPVAARTGSSAPSPRTGATDRCRLAMEHGTTSCTMSGFG